jgi:hypothetical protein
MVSIKPTIPDAASPDSSDRIEEFLARHGGPGLPRREGGDDHADLRGWSEVYAADGYTLRCDWSRTGDRTEMQFTEVPP